MENTLVPKEYFTALMKYIKMISDQGDIRIELPEGTILNFEELKKSFIEVRMWGNQDGPKTIEGRLRDQSLINLIMTEWPKNITFSFSVIESPE